MDMTGRGGGKRRKEESAKGRTDTEEAGKHTGQFIERQTVTLGPVATGRRAEASESEMKKNWGGGASRVRKRVKVIRNLWERAK